MRLPQLGQEHAHIAQGRTGGGRDGRQGLIHRVRIGVPGVAGAVRLRDHHREGVRDHVVHVASDPGALLLDHDVLDGAVAVEFGRVACPACDACIPPRAHQEAEHPREPENGHAHHEQEGELERDTRDRARQQVVVALGDGGGHRQVEGRDERADPGRDEPGRADDAVTVGRRRVEHDQNAEVTHQDAVAGRHLQHGREPCDRERDRGRHPAQGDGDAEGGQHDERPAVLIADDQAEHQEGDGADDVGGQLRPRQPTHELGPVGVVLGDLRSPAGGEPDQNGRALSADHATGVRCDA